MGRIFQLLGGICQHRVRLNLSFRSDIEWWYMFIERWNGVSLMKPGSGTRQSVHIWTSGHLDVGHTFRTLASGYRHSGSMCTPKGSYNYGMKA